MWIEIAKMLSDLFTQHRDEMQQSKERLSIVFQEMSELLESTAKDLKSNNYPHGKCATMDVLATELVNKLIGKIEVDELDKLNRLLFEAVKLEQEFAKREDPKTIEVLLVASGRLKALSIIYKV